MYEYFALKKYLKSKAGFTLMEIMVVVAVMSILVAVAIPIYKVSTKNYQKNTCLVNLKNLYSVLDTAIINEFSLDSGTEYFRTGTAADTDYSFNIVHYFYKDKITGEDVGEETLLTGNNLPDLFTVHDTAENDEDNKKFTVFLAKFFEDGVPYCNYDNRILSTEIVNNKTINSERNYKGTSYYSTSQYIVSFNFDNLGDPYITKVECSGHNQIYEERSLES